MVLSILGTLTFMALTLFCGVLTNMISTDVERRSHGWAVKVLKHAVTRLPSNLRERYDEEWIADLNDQPSGLSELLFAIGLLMAARKISFTERRRTTEPSLGVVNRVKKRLLDIAFTHLAIVALSPFLIVIAIAIKLDSPGPVFSRQTCVGRKKRTFQLYKFRSVMAEERNVVNERQKVTRIGRFIRSASVDELPLLFNVLLGDMSLVGPRPRTYVSMAKEEGRQEVEQFDGQRPDLKPGLTGLVQLHEYHKTGLEEQDYANRIAADFEYVRDWNLSRDAKLIVKAFTTVMSDTSPVDPGESSGS